MNCEFIQGLLQDYLENTIDVFEKIVVEEHLKVCRECKRELTELKLLFWELDEISQIDLPHEAIAVKEKVLTDLANTELLDNKKKLLGLKHFIAVQNKVIDNSTLFLRFLPGARFAIEKSTSSTKKASSLLEGFIVNQMRVKSKKLLLRGIL